MYVTKIFIIDYGKALSAFFYVLLRLLMDVLCLAYIRKIKRGEFDATDIITHKLSLEEGRYVYEIFDAKEENCIKVVLKP